VNISYVYQPQNLGSKIKKREKLSSRSPNNLCEFIETEMIEQASRLSVALADKNRISEGEITKAKSKILYLTNTIA
jgi:hypothetical protein